MSKKSRIITPEENFKLQPKIKTNKWEKVMGIIQCVEAFAREILYNYSAIKNRNVSFWRYRFGTNVLGP